MAPTVVSVTGTILSPSGPIDVSFRSPWLQGPAANEIVSAQKIRVFCDSETGEFTIELYATDDPEWSPVGWTYDVVITNHGTGTVGRGTMALPYDGGAVDLADVFNPNDATEAGQTYALIGHTHPGGDGGPVAWADITGKPTTFTPSAHNQAISTITGLADQLAALTPLSTFDDLESDVDGINTRVVALEAAPGGGGTAATFARAIVVSGDLTMPSDAGWTPVAGLSLVLPAVVGDEVTLTVDCMFDMTLSAADFFELVVLVGGAIVRCGSNGTATPPAEGDPALYPSQNVRFRGSHVSMSFQVASGDLSGGNVTFGMAHKGTSAAAKIYASATFPFRWTARNDH
jgi:hypothetical protein